eukprot:CAMPEP_0197043318 /NCGR_PEP_ID=MMETSP1384-20130603/19595_1 /TAXON_ID=29189 /ORGANISM="Ammonia sp." /LENGTH=122 /DNA_ID=CAMNT_0042474605 /DNA_START=32 /DNA_END=400 /DNA_ORIENTATION=-
MSDEVSSDLRYNQFVHTVVHDKEPIIKQASRQSSYQSTRNLWLEIPQKEHELRVMSESKLRQKCDQMRVSHEGNKSDMIQRILERQYPPKDTTQATEYQFKLVDASTVFDFQPNANDESQQS